MDKIKQIILEGRNHLEVGNLKKAKDMALEISRFLETQVPREDEVEAITNYLKEILTIQKLAKWKKENRPEFRLLEDLANESPNQTEEMIERLNSIFK
jgi:hypothetical protein